MPIPPKIVELVKKFEKHQESYKSGRYNEAQLRQEFLDPFFAELGWDVENASGLAEAYKDVIHEDAIRIGEFSKAPDYCFRIGGTRKFFLEAKKPSVDLKEDENPAFQIRRYAWSAKLPLSILTDFEEFVVYDCRIRPLKNDKASVGRIFYCKFTDYAAEWDEIVGIFSKNAVLKGAFDKYAEAAKSKKGTSEVDQAFLKEIESWRSELAKNIAINNQKLGNREINFSVQKTIDRIIFLRICEDRGIETYGKLQGLVNGNDIYGRLFEIFERADERYNSGLFHFRSEKDVSETPDDITPRLKIDDKVLKDILKSLYPPESPYAFSVLPVEILGQVYEQFLGQIIHLTEGHHARIEEKPEVKKAGGVYYTPAHIVNYIVKNTVGKLLEEKTPKQAAKLKILDPACGSGSFLIGVYQYLLDWYRDWYVKDGTENWVKGKQPVLYQHGEKDWRLTSSEKKKILLNNIYGVDIDSQAVEVTKLSLLLKVLEGESGEVLNKQLQLFHERVLPDLSNNIKCGNSLIGSDFYNSQQLDLFSEEERYRINAFDWHEEFRVIMENGGFDAVIGNPPWGAEFKDLDRVYLMKKFPLISTKTKDSYLYFILKAISLLKNRGFLGVIIPNTWLLINSAKEFRQDMLAWQVHEIIDYGDGVFQQATVESCVLILSKFKVVSNCRAVRIRRGVIISEQLVAKKIWTDDEYCRIIVDMDQEKEGLLKKLSNDPSNKSFEQRCTIIWGIKPYQVGYGVPPQTREMVDKRIYHSETKKGNEWKPLIVGSNVNRYSLFFSGNNFIKYGKWLMYPSNEAVMLGPKIVMRQTSDILRACYDGDGFRCQNSTFLIHSTQVNLKFLLGLLNSKLMGFLYKLKNPQTGKVFAEIKPSAIKQLPIPNIESCGSDKKLLQEQIIKLTDAMLNFHRKILQGKTEQEKIVLQRQVDATDQEIDRLVYQLYGLTADETKIVENSIKGK